MRNLTLMREKSGKSCQIDSGPKSPCRENLMDRSPESFFGFLLAMVIATGHCNGRPCRTDCTAIPRVGMAGHHPEPAQRGICRRRRFPMLVSRGERIARRVVVPNAQGDRGRVHDRGVHPPAATLEPRLDAPAARRLDDPTVRHVQTCRTSSIVSSRRATAAWPSSAPRGRRW